MTETLSLERLAGCVAAIETAAVSLGELGNAPRFSAAVEGGRLAVRESTCPAIHAALQAAEKGVPFMPLCGLIGSDLLKVRPDWLVIDNPLAEEGDPIVVLPALKPDIALFHAPCPRRSTSRRWPRRPRAHGLWGLAGRYEADREHLAAYARLAVSEEAARSTSTRTRPASAPQNEPGPDGAPHRRHRRDAEGPRPWWRSGPRRPFSQPRPCWRASAAPGPRLACSAAGSGTT